MLKDQDLIDYGFERKMAMDSSSTDVYTYTHVLPTYEYEKKKMKLITGEDKSDYSFCYFITIRPKHGYTVDKGIIIHSNIAPHGWGNVIFDGVIESREDFGKLLKQLGING